MSRMIENAEENDDGELIWEHTVPVAAGGTREIETNVTHLLTPGTRKTGTVEHLVIEAELYDEGEGGGNPARPVNAEVAKQAIEKIESEGLEPAWRLVDEPGEFP